MTAFLVDTNVISEMLRVNGNPSVIAWSERVDKESLYLSVISMGELRKGIPIMTVGARRSRLEQSIEEQVPIWFGDRILPLTQGIAERWGVLDGKRQVIGRPLNVPYG